MQIEHLDINRRIIAITDAKGHIIATIYQDFNTITCVTSSKYEMTVVDGGQDGE